MLKLATADFRRTQRLEAVASTGVRAAGKIGVRQQCTALQVVHGGCATLQLGVTHT